MLRRLQSYLIHRELQNCPLRFGELSGDVDQLGGPAYLVPNALLRQSRGFGLHHVTAAVDQDQVAVHEPA